MNALCRFFKLGSKRDERRWRDGYHGSQTLICFSFSARGRSLQYMGFTALFFDIIMDSSFVGFMYQ